VPTHIEILRGPDQADLIRREVLADIFEATAARRPQHIALICGEQQLSYAKLDALADRAASRLMQAGVRPGDMVGLWLPRGCDLLVLQLAIAKSGAGWLPFDADTPVDRVKVCLDDAQAKGLVSSRELLRQPDLLPVPLWLAGELLADELLADERPSGEPGQLWRREGAQPSDPAYVIYTSGSTGKPKGILISQGSICHFLRSENSRLGVCENDVVYQGFSVAFDMSFEEIWISYLVGATLWLAPKEIASNPEELPQALIDHGVTVLHAVPTLLALFNQEVPSLRIINLGGEMCPPSLVDKWARPGRQIFNTYGPTEATVSASLALLEPGHTVTIGTPLPNYVLLVIDPDVAQGLKLLPRGDVGELCISGPGVATGYLGRPDLTAEKFLPNPWALGMQDARLYRTGDLARIDEEGCVQCLGRADDQVKIRGFRVELGEIEAALAEQAGVGTAAVLLRQDQGIDQLVAYLVPESGVQLARSSLRQALSDRLPPYMVPGRFETLAEMPRLASGKIDRKALKAHRRRLLRAIRLKRPVRPPCLPRWRSFSRASPSAATLISLMTWAGTRCMRRAWLLRCACIRITPASPCATSISGAWWVTSLMHWMPCRVRPPSARPIGKRRRRSSVGPVAWRKRPPCLSWWASAWPSGWRRSSLTTTTPATRETRSPWPWRRRWVCSCWSRCWSSRWPGWPSG
jgi:amino acid adenylation domain-containing protein